MHDYWVRFRKAPSVTAEAIPSRLASLIMHYCKGDDLSTFDPYDVWKNPLGFAVKRFYHRRPSIGFLAAAILGLLDLAANNELRFFYSRTEYPIVRSMAALCLLRLYRFRRDSSLIECADRHLEWLISNSSKGYHGYCWGLGIPYTTSNIVYKRDTPMSTITPYALDAFIQAFQISGRQHYLAVIESIFRFFDGDLRVMEEDEEAIATSYGPSADRVVINAVSYNMYAHCAFLPYSPTGQRAQIEAKAVKLYNYIRRHQRDDGAWLYSPHGKSFIDCFHSCIVLKNLIKSNQLVRLDGAEQLIKAGYNYIVSAFLDEHRCLFRRFALRNKPSLVRFDLYDNAEALNLALLLGNNALAQRLLSSVLDHFSCGMDFYSQIDIFGRRRSRNTLRWAVLPFLYGASAVVMAENQCKIPSIEMSSKN